VFLNLFQTWQYVEAILPYEFMTRSKYQHLFLQTKHQFKHIYPPDETDKPFSEYKSSLIYSNDSISKAVKLIKIINIHGEKKKVEFLSAPFLQIFKDTIMPPCWIELTGEFKLEDFSTDASVIVAIDAKNQPITWFWKQYYLIKWLDVEHEWKKIAIRIDLPELKNPNGILSVSIINDSKTSVEAKNVSVRLLSK
jgi:hypothetical protein